MAGISRESKKSGAVCGGNVNKEIVGFLPDYLTKGSLIIGKTWLLYQPQKKKKMAPKSQTNHNRKKKRHFFYRNLLKLFFVIKRIIKHLKKLCLLMRGGVLYIDNRLCAETVIGVGTIWH